MTSMLRLYALVKPVVGFSQDTRKVVTIPTGTLLELMVRGEPVGICNTSWNGRSLMVFSEDVDRSAITIQNQE